MEELYVPALSEAARYDRCCAYFSSSVLSAAARGFGRLIERLDALGEEAPRPAVRLVVNEELAEEDVRALTERGDTKPLEALLQRRFKNPTDALEKQRLAMLGWLVQRGLLEVRVGVMRRGEGIVHAKFGIVTDEARQAVVFSGSGNESGVGLLGNYERLEVSTSWEDPERHREYMSEFTALWTDTHADVHTVTLPEALRLRLVRFAPKETPASEPSNALARQKAGMLWQFIVEAPYLADGGSTCDATAMVDLWPHQRRVVQEAASAWPEGRLLCDEVGMGKTVEAMLILRRLLAGRGVRRVLILLPAGLLKQWQAELREKGGMMFPRLEGSTLFWPDDRTEKVRSVAEALERDLLLMSRETARTESNRSLLLAATPWDLIILDEAHAARRREQEEGEFNKGTLLLELLRQLQLRRRTRGFLLLSATPMQTHPWEPWDLLAVLGEGGAWLADFAGVRDFYQAVAATRRGLCDPATARKAARLIAADAHFPALPAEATRSRDPDVISKALAFVPPSKSFAMAEWLRRGSPLARRMHRNTRETLRRYHEKGLLELPPPHRSVDDIVFDFADAAERHVYDAITAYIEKRFEELEKEKPGKGFVMTIYRRRASSSPVALQRSLNRRRQGLLQVEGRRAYDPELPPSDVPESLDSDDLPEEAGVRVSAAFPQDPQSARREREQLERVLDQLHELRGRDSKLGRFFRELRRITDDGRAVLVFTEYTDTLEYLRDNLVGHYGESLGCYSGDGGQRWEGDTWTPVTKDAITTALRSGELRALLCTDAASEGLNLQAAGALINYDLPWNPSKVEQRIGRIDRIGQALPDVKVVNLFLKDSVDDKVYGALRRRCGLFEHFVGSMQPVLARARRMLLGQDAADPGVLEEAAQAVQQDPLIEEIFLESLPTAHDASSSALHRDQIEKALSTLDVELGVRVKSKAGAYQVSGAGPRAAFSLRVEVLERERTVLPLSPLEPRLKELAGRLSRPGERLPLVVGAHQQGAFRAVAAYWVDGREVTRVHSFDELERQVSAWSGDYPPPDAWLRALEAAREEAQEQVRQAMELASARQQEGLLRQVEAATLRLLRELGRYLVCLGREAVDLNALLHEQISRSTGISHRLNQAMEKLGGYPDWSEDLRRELEAFSEGLTENQRRARLLGGELTAALEDPRWSALQPS